MRIRFAWLVNAVAVGALLGGMGLPALSQSGPAFSTRTPVSGEMGGTFFVSLPIFNTGSAEADNVQLTSATLGPATLISPVLPVAAGTLAAGDYYGVALQFSASNLAVGHNYLLTVRGTYSLGSQTLGFAVNRFVAPSVATGVTLTELQHSAVLDAMTAFANTLPGVDRAADDQSMLTFVQSRPEFVASGIDASSFSVWAVFANGEEVGFVNDRLPAGSSAAVKSQPHTPLRASIPGNLVASLVPMIPAQISGPGATPANAVEIPDSSDVRLMNALPPGVFEGGKPLTDIATILTPQNYKPKTELPSVFNLICVDPTTLTLACSSGLVGGDGVFYYASHGGFVGDGTPVAPLRFGVWTTTKYDSYLDLNVLPTKDVFGTPDAPPTLIKLVADVGTNDYETHYAITASFVRKYFQNFSNNSFIYIDVCSSDDPRTGPDSAQDFKQAFFEKNASVYAGWTATADDGIDADSARAVFDRLLGANQFFPETGPPQRPFPWTSLPGLDGDLRMHKLGFDGSTSASLEFTPNPNASASVFGLLAPSIVFMEILEGAPQNLDINGVFGSDPGVNGGVFVGGSDPSPYPWAGASQTTTAGSAELFPCDWTMFQGSAITCVLPFTGTGSYGNVQVSVRGHNSNVARITQWQGPFTFKMKSTGGPQDTSDTISATLTVNTAFRADIRSYRPFIHDPPVPPGAAGFELIPPLSSASYSCSGGAQFVEDPGPPPFIVTYEWTGSGNLQPYDFSSAPFGNLPPTKSFNSGGILTGTASSLPLSLTLEAHGGNTECTATITVVSTGEKSTANFDIPFGAIPLSLNLDPVTAVIPAPQTPLQFPNTGCLFTPGDSSCNVSLNWSAISPVGNSAPNPNAAQ